MEQKTIVLYSVPKWNRKQRQKNGAKDNCTVQCAQMEQKTEAEKWSGRQLNQILSKVKPDCVEEEG